MIRKSLIYLLCGVALLFLVAAVDVQAMVALDQGFGENGLIFTELGTGSDEAAAIAVQPDGKIVVAGSSDSGIDGDMALVRYLPDGSVDPEFLFSAGHTIGAAYGDDGVRALVISDDGTILLGGYIGENGTRSGTLVRVLANGRLDYDFGNQGVVTLDIGDTDSEFYDISILPDGRIMATGASGTGNIKTPLLAMFLGDGSVDASFGSGGALTDASIRGEAFGLVLQSDGNLLVTGYALDENERRGLYLARYEAEGQIDSSFGDQGRVIEHNPLEEIIAHDIVLQRDGQIILTGEVIAENNQHRIMIARFASDGSPDRELADNGILVHDAGMNSAAYAVTVLQSGEILASGFRLDASGMDMMILRYEVGASSPPPESQAQGDSVEIIKISSLKVEEGSLSLPEPATKVNMVTTNLAGSDEISRAIVAMPDGTIYSAGSSGTGEDTAFIVAKYSAVDQEIEAVGLAGAVITPNYTIETTPITGVTRVGALTGGVIGSLPFDSSDCLAECEAACTGTDAEIATCKAACPANCAMPTINQRGVVYSVDPNPEYKEGDDTETPAPVDPDPGEPENPDDGDNDDDDTDGNNPFGSDKLFDFDNFFVLRGQTNDGSGIGEYSSEIEDVNPQTEYYVRAYALLSDGSIIYGNEYHFKTDDSCFIATAAFGSIDDFAVRTLRDFRDRFLKPSEWGQAFIRLYYHLSPPIADVVGQSVPLRVGVMLLLLPFVFAAMFMLYTSLLAKYFLAVLLGYWYLKYRDTSHILKINRGSVPIF